MVSRRGRGIASISLLSALLVGYGVVLYFDDAGEMQGQRRVLEESSAGDRSLEAGAAFDPDVDPDEARELAKNADSPPALDEVAGEYIVKPWVGNAATDVWETFSETLLEPMSAQASSVQGSEYLPRYTVDPIMTNRWESSTTEAKPEEWLQIDLGGPQRLAEVYIKWGDAYAVDYSIQTAMERTNCRRDGGSCPDTWFDSASVTGKSNSDATQDVLDDGIAPHPGPPQGVRYLRIKMSQRAAGRNNFSIYYVKVYRTKMVVGHENTGTYCGATVGAVASTLLSRHGGSLIQTYPNAGFFSASMTDAQMEAMFADECTFTAEPNYVVRARGRLGRKPGSILVNEPERRKLAIPEFNLKDEEPGSWGLERVSSHGRLNGKYIWFHEGADTNLYLFDTAVYPDHSDWLDRNDVSRLADPYVCTGTATDYTTNNHGTHLASIMGGFKYGLGKSATIHPIVVLDANGEGTTASVLCGMEKLLQDGIDYNAANAPKKIRSVVNLSLGVGGRSDALDKAVKDMTDVGYTVVIAAGDHDGNACFYSPYDHTAITVGALKNHPEGYNDKTSSSNYGQCVDVWAPGEDIVAASNAGEFETASMSGTSVAAAFAAGAASLFYEGVNTKEYTTSELSAMVKEKLIYKAEVNILGNIGHMSYNRNLQTTVAKCSLNSHCMTGLTCIFDGSCRDLSQPLK